MKFIIQVYLILYFFFDQFFLEKHLNIRREIKDVGNHLNKYKTFFFLRNKPVYEKSLLIEKEKKELLKIISKILGRKIEFIHTIFISSKLNFGNQILLINTILFFCEIIGCRKIILDKNHNWFIKRKIIYRKYNIILAVDEEKNYIRKNTIFDISSNFFYYAKYIKPELRMNVIKKEILSNIPKYKSNPNNLFIYIRSGDIFIKGGFRLYSQPPLCFYKKIIDNNKYEKIYIISKSRNNPVINELLKQYHNIRNYQNNLQTDIGLLVSAYSIVGAVSTFINVIIRLNDNLRFYYDYSIDSLLAKINHFHYLFYKLPRSINTVNNIHIFPFLLFLLILIIIYYIFLYYIFLYYIFLYYLLFNK
jgi:hypothetical protein